MSSHFPSFYLLSKLKPEGRHREILACQVKVALIISVNGTEANPINKSFAECMVFPFYLAPSLRNSHMKGKKCKASCTTNIKSALNLLLHLQLTVENCGVAVTQSTVRQDATEVLMLELLCICSSKLLIQFFFLFCSLLTPQKASASSPPNCECAALPAL